MCLALMVMGFAVWAASTQTLPVTNTVDFVSIHVLSTVTGTVTGAKTGTFTNYGPVSTLAGDPEGTLGTWAIGSATEFAVETEPIVITLTIVNNSDERSLSFELSGQAYTGFNGTNLGDTNIDRTCVYSINNLAPITNATYTSGAINVEALKTATIVITLDISDNGKSVTAFDNSFSTTLRNVGEVTENFSFNSSAKTLTLNSEEPLTEENVPEMIVEGEPVYYGLYEDQAFTQKVQFPYSGSTTLYAKFAEEPASLTFNANGVNNYTVAKDAVVSPVGVLEIPEKYNWKDITEIEAYGFLSCNKLTSVVIPSTITDIGFCAFEFCSNLANVSIPDSVSFVGKSAFLDTDWYDNKPNGLVYAGKVAYKYKGTMPSSTSIVLTDGTKSISDDAFLGCSGLGSISIPEGLTHIGNSAFKNCTSLYNLVIPDSVCDIDPYAFENSYLYNHAPNGMVYFGKVAYKYKGTMTVITPITLLEGTTGIAGMAFDSCTNLSSITMPNTVSVIGDYAFYYCNITSITLSSSLTDIGNYAFYATDIEYINIPDTTTYIGGYAFSMSRIRNISIPNGITTVYASTFSNCTLLTEVTLPSSITSIGPDAFKGCHNLTSIVLPSNVTIVDNGAFNGCSGLTSFTLPDSVTKIGNEVFYNCTNLSTFDFSSNVNYVGKYAFYNTAWYNAQPDGVVYLDYVALTYKGTMPASTNINFAEGTKIIADSAFKGFLNLNSIAASEGLTTIQASAFSGCSNMVTVTLPSSISLIDTEAFYACNKTTTISLQNNPNNSTIIGSRAFNGCWALTSISLPNSVQYIGQWAFSGCIGLTSVTLPNNITTIETHLFYNCSKLTSVVIPNTVTQINDYAFDGCSVLSSLTLSSTLTKIENYAFSNTALTTINIPSTVSSIGFGVFSTSVTSFTVDESSSYFKSIDGVLFNKLGTILVYYPCNKAGTEYSIPNGVLEIGGYAFYRNINLTKITLPSSLEFIGGSNVLLSSLVSIVADNETILQFVTTNTTNSEFLSEADKIYLLEAYSPSGEFFEESNIDVPDGYCDSCGLDESAHHEYIDNPDGLCDQCGQDEYCHTDHSFIDDDMDGLCDQCGLDEASHTDHSFIDEVGDGLCDQCGNDQSSHPDHSYIDEIGGSESVYKFFEPATSDLTGYSMWTKVTTDYGQW